MRNLKVWKMEVIVSDASDELVLAEAESIKNDLGVPQADACECEVACKQQDADSLEQRVRDLECEVESLFAFQRRDHPATRPVGRKMDHIYSREDIIRDLIREGIHANTYSEAILYLYGNHWVVEDEIPFTGLEAQIIEKAGSGMATPAPLPAFSTPLRQARRNGMQD